jgi:UDP-2,4-diacetamido-2,4,6-trideoxy-beta-L-altropyranose hydrolase
METKTHPGAEDMNNLKGIQVLLRPDTGPSAGLGHLRRCLALASALEELSARCSWFLPTTDAAAQKMMGAQSSEIICPETTDQTLTFKEILRLIEERRFSATVVDSYTVTENDLLQLREKGLFVVAIDDLCAYEFPCQLVVNHSLRAPRLPYKSSSGDTRFLLGSEYALLAREFCGPTERRIRDRIQNILVSLGGSDVHNLMPKLIRILDALPLDFSLSCVVGPLSKNRTEVESAVRESSRKTRIVNGSGSMRQSFLESDLAVSAGGQTLFELAALGTPTIAVQVADNQANNLQSFAERGIIRFVGEFNEPAFPRVMSEAVSSLASDTATRLRMSEDGRKLIDCMGALRVAGCIAEAIRNNT